MARTIKQTVTFKAPPHIIFEMLMDSEKHAAFTGEEALISREIDGGFAEYSDFIEGINMEIEQDKKIVQKWRAKDWPEGHYSTVTYDFVKEKNDTVLTMVQTNVPDDQYESITKGWATFYWNKMKEVL